VKFAGNNVVSQSSQSNSNLYVQFATINQSSNCSISVISGSSNKVGDFSRKCTK
jgi:hypothetical protein